MDTVRRHIKFDYYRVVSRNPEENPANKDTLFDFRRWIQKVLKLSLEGRTFDYHQERARLEKAGFDLDLDQWYLHFVRLRDSLLPSKAKISENVEPFELGDDEYLGEEVSALYHEDDHILMLQRNRFSLGPSGVEDYVNLVWDNENKEHIYLRPIRALDAVERVKSGDQYRRIALRFADLDKKDMPNSVSPIKKMILLAKEYGAVNAEIIFTMGRARDTSLTDRTVSVSIDDLVSNKGLATHAEIGVKNEDSSVEIIDLFEERAQNGAFFDVPRRTTLSHEAIFAEMVNIYGNNRVRLLKYLKG